MPYKKLKRDCAIQSDSLFINVFITIHFTIGWESGSQGGGVGTTLNTSKSNALPVINNTGPTACRNGPKECSGNPVLASKYFVDPLRELREH